MNGSFIIRKGRNMKNNLFALFIVLAVFTSCVKEEKWIPLFNGRDLSGWTVKFSGYPAGENFNNTFLVEAGIMKVSYAEYDTFRGEYGHIFYHEPFSHYRLRLEYRFVSSQAPGGPAWGFKNSGVMFHSQSPESMLPDQDFPVSIEVQFLGGTGEGSRPTANVCTPGTHVMMNGQIITDHCIPSRSASFHGDEWVAVELIVHGDSIIHHIVNGDTVLTYTKPQTGGEMPEGFPLAEGTPLKSGYIALQAESHPVEFRKVELLRLDKKK